MEVNDQRLDGNAAGGFFHGRTRGSVYAWSFSAT